ncbi:putative ABC transporter, ATP-binding protein [Desulfosarcina variabilis str. Montpellier]|uniref:ABC transporter ATP-binding protein n=1 Tax=Desulfosarcina variabilis TaxID=2300 RepID=UPI003AFAEEED
MESNPSIKPHVPTATALPHENPESIQARGLTRIYQIGTVQVTGIRDIDLTVPSGQLVVLKGDSGSGKSTLLSLLAGLDRLTAGQLTVAGHDLERCSETELTEFRRNTVGVIFQAFNLLPTLSVLENVCLPALLAGRAYYQVRPKAKALLEWLGLTKRIDHQPHQLSGGEMQRTAIARALINDPAMVLADEPTGNLDSGNAGKVMALLADLNRRFRRTVVVATHSNLADAHATMMLRLKDGRVVS